MTDRYYLTAGGHVLIGGATGAGDRYGGKSSTAHWWVENLISGGWVDSVFVVDPGSGPYQYREFRTLRGMAQSYHSGTRRFTWPRESGVTELVEFVDALSGSSAIVFDEAWMYDGSEGMENCIRNLGNQEDPVRGIVVSQRPYDLPESIRNSCPVKCWVGPITTEGEQYFRSGGMGHIPDGHDLDPFHWIVTDGGEVVDVNPPVPEEYA